MTTPLSPTTTRILELLADGAWHEREELLREAAKTVPPGKAFRAAERDRNRLKQRPDGPGGRVRGDDSTSIDTGVRLVARQALNGLGRRGHVQRDGDRIRLIRPPSSDTDPA